MEPSETICSKRNTAKGLEKMHVASVYTAAALYIPLKMNFGKDRALEIFNEGAETESLKKMPGRMSIPARE